VGSLVGHNTIRQMVMPNPERVATADEIDKMQSLVEEALERGAFGLSSGLMYSPGMFADDAELIALLSATGRRQRIYTTHMRDEGDRLLESVAESLYISRRGQVRLQISHHKAVGKQNWGKTAQTIELIDERRNDQEVNLDFYPYTATSTVLRIIVPAEIVQRIRSDYSQLDFDQNDEDNIEKTGLQNLCLNGWNDVVITSSKVTESIGKSIGSMVGETSGYRIVVELLKKDPNTRAVFLLRGLMPW